MLRVYRFPYKTKEAFATTQYMFEPEKGIFLRCVIITSQRTKSSTRAHAIVLIENFHRFALCATICVHLVSNKAKPHVVYYVVYYSSFSFFF